MAQLTVQRKAAIDALMGTLPKYSYLASMYTYDQEGFYTILKQYPADLLPIVYTPGVGEACQNWGALQPAPPGVVLSTANRGQFLDILQALPNANTVRAIVVTDGAPLPRDRLCTSHCRCCSA